MPARISASSQQQAARAVAGHHQALPMTTIDRPVCSMQAMDNETGHPDLHLGAQYVHLHTLQQ
jgi:hypothetical protein